MPQINLIPEVLYEPNQPYHYLYDNIPLKNILARISLVNIQTDTNAEMLRGLAGSAGSISARLGESLEDDGSLKTSAVNDSMHGIDHHEDGGGYVRMRDDERSKLSLIDDRANELKVRVNNNALPDEETSVDFRSSSSIFFTLESTNIIRAHHNLPSDMAHRHVYGQTPAHRAPDGSSSSSSGPDWKHFKTLLSTPYMDGSLRVYINGVRIGPGVRVPIFTSSTTPASWMLFSVAGEDPETGDFELNSEIPYGGLNIISIDFEIAIALSSSSSSSSSS